MGEHHSNQNPSAVSSEQTATSKKAYVPKPLDPKYCKFGGTYFHSASIIGHKNVFVTDEYIEILTNAFRMSEIQKDIKNLAYVIMPNHFYWMFRLSAKDNNPYEVIGNLKKNVALAVLKTLEEEMKDKPYKPAPIFRWNKFVGRSAPDKILNAFSEEAKKMEGNQKHRVWMPKTQIRLIEDDEMRRQKLEVIKSAPTTDRWRLVDTAEKYPYLYVSDEMMEEFANVGEESNLLQMPVMMPAMA